MRTIEKHSTYYWLDLYAQKSFNSHLIIHEFTRDINVVYINYKFVLILLNCDTQIHIKM